jgi:hypothetical protein
MSDNPEIRQLLLDIECAEKECLRKFKANPDDWQPPRLTFIDDFHAKYSEWRTTHPEYYDERYTEAIRQQISILRTKLRIAEQLLEGQNTNLFSAL